MSTALHVNGLATIKIGGSVLGWTVDGVTMSFIGYFEDVYTDKNGPKIPEDVICYGEECRVTAELIVYDATVLAATATRISGGTLGSTPNNHLGYLMATCGGTHTLDVAKGTSCNNSEPEGGWHFPCAYLMDNHDVKVGNKPTRHTCVWRCLPNSSGVLYTVS